MTQEKKEWSGEELKALVDSGEVNLKRVELVSGLSTSTLYKIFRGKKVRPKTRNKAVSAFRSVLSAS